MVVPFTDPGEETPMTDLDRLKEKVAGSRITCAECGWTGHALPGHLAEAHSMTGPEYKKKHPKGKLASRLVTELIHSLPREAQRSSELEPLVEQFDFPTGENADCMAQLTKIGLGKGGCSDALRDMVPQIEEHFWFEEHALRTIAWAIHAEKNIFDEGPTGCGKTAKFMQIFARMDQPIDRINMNGEVTPKNFIGEKVKEGRSLVFQPGIVPRCMTGDGQRGYPLILDEVDYAPPHILALMSPVLEGSARSLYIPEMAETIHARPGFFVIATANTGGRGDRFGNFTGTEIMNTAFLDRYGVKMKSDYLPEPQEVGMLRARFPSETDSDVGAVVQGANLVREAFKNGQLNLTLSTRKLIDYFDAKGALGAEDAADVTLLNWTDQDDEATIREMLVRKNVPGVTVQSTTT